MIKNVSKEEFNELLKKIDDAKNDRAEKMPDEKAALFVMFEAYQRLKELGWNDAIYSPKDGSMFSSIEAGSTGIHKCNLPVNGLMALGGPMMAICGPLVRYYGGNERTMILISIMAWL
jgi:hypothetical protein